MKVDNYIKEQIRAADIKVNYIEKGVSKEFTLLADCGNQGELDRFIAECDESSAKKFPLAFYVTSPVRTQGGFSYCDTDIIIMTNTNPSWLSGIRVKETYEQIIEPAYEKLTYFITTHPYIKDISDRANKYSYTDVPTFGLLESTGANAIKNHNQVGRKKSEASVITDYVDARVIKLKLRINTNCIKT